MKTNRTKPYNSSPAQLANLIPGGNKKTIDQVKFTSATCRLRGKDKEMLQQKLQSMGLNLGQLLVAWVNGEIEIVKK
jgi:hypothetical protein